MATTATKTSTATWTAPPPIEDFSGTVLEEDSVIYLRWTETTLAPSSFIMYRLYRRVNGESTWHVLEEFTQPGRDSYRDVNAGQNVTYQYKIRQFKWSGTKKIGSDSSDVVTATLTSDSWFLNPNQLLDTIELLVTDETHTAVIQQEVFEPLASTKKRIMRGAVLGDEGQLTATFDASSAMSAKAYFDAFNGLPGPHTLKSPFGDVWLVECDAPGYRYIPGGHLEVTFGWVEISD